MSQHEISNKQTVMHSSKTWWSVAAICLAAFIAIALLSAQIFERVPHSEDEVAYIFQAKVFAQNRLAVPTPPYADAFWSPFVLDYQGRRFGKYPPGWPLLLSLGVRLKAPWLINAGLGTLTLALIAGLGRRFYGSGSIPIIAAGLGLVTPGFLFLSSSLLSHSASLFWATLALLALSKICSRSHIPHPTSHIPHPTSHIPHPTSHIPHPTSHPYALLTGIFLGAAFLTRPFAALGLGLPVGIFILTLILRGELRWTVLLWLLLGGLPLAALLPLYWWAITGDPTFNAYLLVWPYDRIGFGPDIGPEGYTLSDAIFINTRLKLQTLATGLFGWPGWSSLMFLPIPFLAKRANRWDWLLLGTIASIIFAHIFYWSFGGKDGGFPRYYYDALPAFLLLTARGIQLTYQYLRQKKLPLSFGGRTVKMHWLLVALIVSFIGYNFIWNLPPLLAAQKGKYNITPAPLQVVARANLQKPALILVQNVELWSDFAAPFAANSPTLNGPIVYAIDWGPGLTQKVRAHFAERDCWELSEDTLQPCARIEAERK